MTVADLAQANGFVRWLDELELTKEQAAKLLGKTVRAIENYERGVVVPPLDTRMLMDAIAQGYKPRPWPER